MQFYARPNQLLVDHLKNVSENVEKIFKDIQISGKTTIREVAKMTAYFHDFGKYTSYFQDKLTGKNPRRDLSNHSYISAIMCATYLRKNFPQAGLYVLSSFASIVAHHSDLPDTEEMIPNIDRKSHANIDDVLKKLFYSENVKRLKVIKKQLENLRGNSNLILKEYQLLNIKLDESYFKEESIVETIKYLQSKYKELTYLSEEEEKKNIALTTQIIFSILIDADKKDAAGFVDSTRVDIPSDLVEKYLQNLKSKTENKMNQIRNLLRKSVLESVEETKFEKVTGKIFTITAPTGSGKTLTALDAALKLREKFKKEKGYTPRIIYSLPYISIIEQTLKVIDSLLNQIPDYKNNREKYFVAHYHLAENAKEKDIEEDEIDYNEIDRMNLFIESWDSEIILTTFWQLLHTILGYKNRLMKKFYKLSGSIVILDEVQTIPAEHWKILERFLELLSSQLSTTFILMTATQPMLLEEKSIELNKHVDVIFKSLERTKIINLTQINDFQEIVSQICSETIGKNTLFVFNTVSDSIRKYKILKQFKERIYYLSTNITPKDRFERLEKIKELIEKKKKEVTVVSTQVIEAGVDLDFDVVVREIAPLHSIVQVAGRCNRNYRKKRPSKMYLINTEENTTKKVYGTIHIHAVKEIIDKYFNAEKEILEGYYLEIIREYFKIVRQRAAKSDEMDKIWQSFLDLRFKSSKTLSLSDYQLIDYKPEISIFVIKDEEDQKIFETFRRILNSKDFLERKKLFILNKRKIEERLLHVYVERAKKNLPPAIDYIDSVRFINPDNLEIYYDLETGFKYTDEEIKSGVIW